MGLGRGQGRGEGSQGICLVEGPVDSGLGTKEKGRKVDFAGPRSHRVRGKDDNGPAGACCCELMRAWPTSQIC